MTRADSNNPGYGYLTMYQGNKGLPPGDTGRYTRAIGLRVGPAASFSVRGWRMLMSSNGALGVVGLTPFLHIRVVTEMFEIGRAHVCTPVTNAHLVCRLLLEKKKTI